MVRKRSGGGGSFLAGSLAWGSAVWGIEEEADSLAQRIYGWLPPSSCLSATMSSRVRRASSCGGSKAGRASAHRAAIPDSSSNTLVLAICDPQEPSPTSTQQQQPNQDQVRRKKNKKNLPIRGVHFAEMEAGTLSWVQKTVKRKGAREKSAPWVCSRVFKFEMGDHCVLVVWRWSGGPIQERCKPEMTGEKTAVVRAFPRRGPCKSFIHSLPRTQPFIALPSLF